MNGSTGNSTSLRPALIRECEIEFMPRLAMLLEVTRVYWHALRCPQCVRFAGAIGGISLSVARQVGSTIRGWQVLGLRFDDVVKRPSLEIVTLVHACLAADELADDPELIGDWFLALHLAGLRAADRNEQLDACPIIAADESA